MSDPIQEVQLYTTRETVVMAINNNAELAALGLPEDAVLQADTATTPAMRPFIIVRWLDEQPGVGPVSLRPFDLWGYDSEGDYTRIERILSAAAGILTDMIAVKTESGMISQIKGSGVGLGRGSDLYDDGYKCVVIPWRLQAIATGL
jgi:hypothetical protein